MRSFVISFYTTSDAMQTEEVMQKAMLPGRLIPVPRELSAGCGIAFAGNENDREKIKTILQKENIEWEDEALLDI